MKANVFEQVRAFVENGKTHEERLKAVSVLELYLKQLREWSAAVEKAGGFVEVDR